jgi:hypothetical protein
LAEADVHVDEKKTACWMGGNANAVGTSMHASHWRMWTLFPNEIIKPPPVVAKNKLFERKWYNRGHHLVLHTQKCDVNKVFQGGLMIVNGHGFAAAVLGAPASMVDHFVGVGLADTAGSMALNKAVAAPTVQSHRIIQ